MILLWIAAPFVLAWAWLFTFGPFRPIDAGPPATARPRIAATSVEVWQAERPRILSALAEHVYGPEPAPITSVVASREPIAAADVSGVEGVEQWRVELGAAGYFNMVLVRPPGDAPAPLILMQNFAGNPAAFLGRPPAIRPPHLYYPKEIRNPNLDPLLRAIFGRYMAGAPFDLLARRGYAIALVYGGDIAPDHKREAHTALTKFAPEGAGTLSAWAWLYSRMLDAVSDDVRIDAARVVAFGQSRQGKAALLAGARDERFAAVVGLQPGRGGDALTQHRSGESVRGMTKMFPHWFTPRFAAYADADPPVDQHQMLALIAPRPLLIGRANNDAWADPLGGRAAMAGAAPAFALYGAPPPKDYVRPGRHGIHLRDWIEVLGFLDDRLKPVRAPGSRLE